MAKRKDHSFETIVQVLGHTVRVYFSSEKSIPPTLQRDMSEEGADRAESMIKDGYVEGQLYLSVQHGRKDLEYSGWWSIVRDQSSAEINNCTKKYKYKGVVFGDTWDGTTVGYSSKTLYASNSNDGREALQKAYDSENLDSGFGFRNLTGALIVETCYTTVTVEGLEYTRSDEDGITIGVIPDWYEGYDYE